MRVDDRNLNGAAGPQPGRTSETRETDPSGATPATHVSGTGDRAEISTLAAKISDALKTDSAERTRHIRKVAEELNAGRYMADSHATSRAVIREALESKDEAR